MICHCYNQGPPPLHFESLQLLNFKFNAEPDLEPAFQSNVDPDPAFRNDVDPHVSGFVTMILSRAEVESGLAYTENKENWVILERFPNCSQLGLAIHSRRWQDIETAKPN